MRVKHDNYRALLMIRRQLKMGGRVEHIRTLACVTVADGLVRPLGAPANAALRSEMARIWR
jgi:hypothetical protein